MKRLAAFVISVTTLLAAGATTGHAAVLMNYASEAEYLAALGPDVVLTYEDFDGFPAWTLITNQIPGVVFSSPNTGEPTFEPIQTVALPEAISAPNVLGGGYVRSKTSRQAIVMEFAPAASAFSFTILAVTQVIREATVTFEFTDGTTQTVSIPDLAENGGPWEHDDPSDQEFFGVTADPFTRVTITSNAESDGLFEKFDGIDDLTFGGVDTLVPICSGSPADVEGVKGVDGTGTDDRPGDSGIASVVLDPTSVNLSLVVDPFDGGDPSATFRVQPASLDDDAQGSVIVTDVAGNSCSLCLNFRNLPPGPTFQEVLCCADDGINFLVTNDETTPAGPSFCTTSPFGPDQPVIPAGYEVSPPNDPWPCSILTIDSPVAGQTDMVMKKDGDFDPRLRLLASSSPDGGVTFPPFSDVTELVEPILDIDPDPTKLKGKSGWSVVKVACAIQAEICDGIDNDGDGEIDEGLPVGDASVDQDLDGFPLCPAPETAPPDCNDQNPAVNPDAVEICDGIDNDCDGDIDEDDPGGGESCAVPGLLGECANGVTACIESTIECVQAVDPTDEMCDGLDNDCDGTADDGNPGGGFQCGTTDVGVCEFGVTACVGGATACVGNIEPGSESCGDGLDNDCDGVTDEGQMPVAVCAVVPSNFNVISESRSFKFNLSSVTNACDPGNPVPLDPSTISTAWVSRVGDVVLPDPASLPCPDPLNGFLGEIGIFENRADRHVTGNDVDLKFNLEADGMCNTQDGSRQDIFALLADALDDSIVPICFSATIDGAAFECCSEAKVTNSGNR